MKHQLYCEVSNSEIRTNDMREKIRHPQGNRMYVPQYHQALSEAQTVGEMYCATVRALSDMAGGHNNIKPELWEKIEKAKRCAVRIDA